MADGKNDPRAAVFHLVLAPNGLEGVAFTDSLDAAATANGRSRRWGDSTIGLALRDAYEDTEIFRIIQVRAVNPVSDEAVAMLDQGCELLEQYAQELKRRGNDSEAAGAEASAYAIRLLALRMLDAEQARLQGGGA